MRDGHAEVLLTGGTGFLGKVVLHELLRRREELGVARVHVLVRGRKERGPELRFREDVLESPCFARLPAGWTEQVELLEGDCFEEGCGIADARRSELAPRVTHLIHCAAAVEFHLPIAQAARANVTSALHVLELSRSLPALASLVSVSTAYVTPHPGDDVPVEERLAALPYSAETLYEAIEQGRYDDPETEARLLAETRHPNTYTLTKCMAEHLLAERRGDVPLRLVRPSIIAASLRRPFEGWLDSAAGFSVFAMMIGSGRMRTVMARRRSRLDLVPVDAVADRVIATAFEPQRGGAELPIRHAVAGYENSPSLSQCQQRVPVFFERNPVPGTPPARLRYLGPDGPRYRLAHWLHHGRSGSALLAGRIAEANARFAYFTHNTFRFRSSLPFEEPGFDPERYLDVTCRGVYRHLLGGDTAEVTLAGRAHRRHGSAAHWVLRQPRGNAFIRLAGYAVDKTLARCAERVSVDVDSFRRAMQEVPERATLVLAPSHRSYLDFVLCSYLCFARPDLDIPIPHIAAAVEFARIPLLGRLFRHMHAFYLERGKGAEDKGLTRQVHELVRSGATLEFFIEGQRSRSRRMLPPRRGMLRSLQATGRTCALLPVAISYDHVPEEAGFLEELAGAPKPPMRLRDLLAWTARMARGGVELGRIHVACGRPVTLDLSREVRDVSHQVVGELQRATVTTTHQLRALLAAADLRGADLAWLRQAITRRGGRVLDVPRRAPPVAPAIERTFRWHFQHLFYPEALRLFPDDPGVRSHVARNGWSAPAPVDLEAELADERVLRLVHALFDSVRRDRAAVAEELRGRESSGAPPLTPRELMARLADRGIRAHLPHVEDALADWTERHGEALS
jgi:1-acyl-sn-glycerol-3-phosphate acyltransferase